MDTGEHRNDDERRDEADELRDETDEQWWARIAPEERYMAIETVRLGTEADSMGGERPTGTRAEFVRRTPEYRERFAGADNIARQDDPGFGPDPVPSSHEHTHPLTDDDTGQS